MLSQKKIFLILVTISTVSLLLHHGVHLNWSLDSLTLGCSSLPLGPWRLSLSSSSISISTASGVKHTSLVFLKTHKTASTTMQNILFRFAERHNLTVALPISGCGHQFCYPQSFSVRNVHPYTRTRPDILTSHTRLNVSEMRRLMPNGTRYITILREPSAMFESLFSYYNTHCGSFKRVPSGSIEEFLRQPQLYYRPEEADSGYARNTLTYDLGGDKDHQPSGDGEYMKRFVQHVDSVFSLVMISEHFDESLVLLRRLLNWEVEDLLYLKLNMRADESRKRLQGTLPAKIRAWNWLDAALYDYFNASLWRQLEELGPACLERELRVMRKAQDWLVRECFGEDTPRVRSPTEIQNKQLRPWQPSKKVAIVGYDFPVTSNTTKEQGGGGDGSAGGAAAAAGGGGGGGDGGRVAKEMCLKMVMPEVNYSELLLRSQFARQQLQRRRATTPRPPAKLQRPKRQRRKI
ncbi:galactose-3-O-sulfotransferase 3 [Engraulis encrasicolus]|uniref:galactose-3-O-sulfotransferase 3 n=1 Tax=Engraulis encrasicolus TaxID=184585 RepID=UPI002FD14091